MTENQDTQYEPFDPDKLEVGVTKDTACDHFFVEDPEQDPNTNMVSVRCVHEGCWCGASYDPEQTALIDGKLETIQER